VPCAFSETLAQAAQAASKIAELFRYPGDDHGLAMTQPPF
jgi:dipeptidyl aminopeptidase/acylaminoacyl peptidase